MRVRLAQIAYRRRWKRVAAKIEDHNEEVENTGVENVTLKDVKQEDTKPRDTSMPRIMVGLHTVVLDEWRVCRM